jgi:hypothetical protein
MTAAPVSGRDLTLAVAPGVLGLLDPTALPPGALMAYRLAVTAITTATAHDALADPELHAPPAVRWLGSAAVAGLTWRTMPRWEAADAAFHRWVTARGVPRSRLVLAVVSTAVVLALTAAERRRTEAGAADDAGELAFGGEQPAG